MSADTIIKHLRLLSSETHKQKLRRFGIDDSLALGTPMPELRKAARPHRKNHALALDLWDKPVHEAKLLAPLIDDPKKVTPNQLDKWVADFYSWDICDQCCINLFRKTPYAYGKIKEYTNSDREFVKRTGFVLIAVLAVHDKNADDETFLNFFPIILQGAEDDRNFVKKAVSWALRQTGKRNPELKAKAVNLAADMAESSLKPVRWVGKDALKELKP